MRRLARSLLVAGALPMSVLPAQVTRYVRYTAAGTTSSGVRMVIDPSGNLGLGTTAPSAAVDVVREGAAADLRATSYGGVGAAGSSGFMMRTARGTALAPTAVQLGDDLGFFGLAGYGATGFGGGNAAMAAFAGENWTDTAQGAGLYLATTPLGLNGRPFT